MYSTEQRKGSHLVQTRVLPGLDPNQARKEAAGFKVSSRGMSVKVRQQISVDQRREQQMREV